MTTPNAPAARMGEDREALADKITADLDFDARNHGKFLTWAQIVRETLKRAESAGFTRSAPGWIACSERMPETPGAYLGCRNGCRVVAFYDSYPNGTRDWSESFTPTHWMPLPPAPANKAREEGRT